MRNVQVLLVYERGGRAIPLARIGDAAFVAMAAHCAIKAAAARADSIARTDDVLGAIERAEAQRLETVLGVLLPGLSSGPVM